MGTYILLGLLAVVVMYAIAIYNRLVQKKNRMQEGWSGIDVQLKKRYNLIPNLVETVKGYAKHEKETFDQVIKARNAAINAKGVDQQQQAENMLTSALSGLFALAEAYPDLKANTNFLQLQEELSKLESDIEKARRYYNATVRENNILIESFPSNIIAGFFNFRLGEFFEIDAPEQRSTPKVSF